MSGKEFDADYFLRGRASGKSLYEDYRWLPNLTVPMCQSIADHCGMEKGQRILDFGCARGYVVKALRGLGYEAFGVDVSEWAIDNIDLEVEPYCILVSDLLPVHLRYDWVIAKDVLEHVPLVKNTIARLMDAADKGVFVVVPLSQFDNSRYVIEEYEADVTHIQRKTLSTWMSMFIRPGWSVEASYRVRGIKDNYAAHEIGNGFITARRI